MSDLNAPQPTIRHYVAGGTEHGGGIGRLVGYVRDAPETQFRHVVVDTRGARFHPVLSVAPLLRAMGAMTVGAFQRSSGMDHLHIAGRGSTARKLVLGAWARLLGAPYVLHLHDYDYAADLARRPAWQFHAIRALFGGARQVVVLGRRDASTVSSALGVPASRITVLRNCVPDPGPRAFVARGPVRILFLGQLGPRKGVPELLAALADPALDAAGWHAVLAGDGPVARYRAEAARLGLARHVSFTGWVDAEAAARLRAEADILVLPSHAEGFAMAVLEGLAQGMAVVTTRVGAHDEVLVDEVNSLLVPPGNATALAAALERLISDPDLRARIAAEGRRLYLRRFRIDRYVRAIEALHSASPSLTKPEPKSA